MWIAGGELWIVGGDAWVLDGDVWMVEVALWMEAWDVGWFRVCEEWIVGERIQAAVAEVSRAAMDLWIGDIKAWLTFGEKVAGWLL